MCFMNGILTNTMQNPGAYLLVSAWLTLIPCSSNIAKYSVSDMVPLPSLSILKIKKIVTLEIFNLNFWFIVLLFVESHKLV